MRDRRLTVLACVGHDDTCDQFRSHQCSALKSGDVTFAEVVLQFAVTPDSPEASLLNQAAAESWNAVQAAEARERRWSTTAMVEN